jgi:hypothetical protein
MFRHTEQYCSQCNSQSLKKKEKKGGEYVMKCCTRPKTSNDSLEQHNQWKVISGTWSERSPYRIVSLKTVARESAQYKFDLLGTQVKWDKCGT